MYLPEHFRIDDAATQHALLKAHPLATLVVATHDGLVANHLPLMLDAERNLLRGHVARANPLWQVHPAHRPVLVIFRGPQAYITPAWYPGKAEHGKVVPTWNYTVVQARGALRVIDGDAPWLLEQLNSLTDSQELHRSNAWQVADAPADYIARMMAAVVGLEITLTGLTGKFKLSQNHPPESRQGVMQGLTGEPLQAAQQVAGLMA